MNTRTPLRKDLANLKQKIYTLGEKCLEISSIYKLLLDNYSIKLEGKLIDVTQEVKKEVKELCNQCFLVLTLQQPLIKDLRFVIGSLQIIINLEKIAEQFLSNLSLLPEINTLEQVLKEKIITVSKNLHDLIQSVLTEYLSLNLAVSEKKATIITEFNLIHDLLYKEVLYNIGKESGYKAQLSAQVLTTLRVFEKIVDTTSNISQQVSFIILNK